MANGLIISDGKNRQLTILGSAQIVLGVISIIANAITMIIFRTFYLPGLPQVGYGFWNGTIFILTGMLGVVSGLQRYRVTTILFGIMSILSACLTVALFTLAIISGALCVIKGFWVYPNGGGSSYYTYAGSEHPNAQKVSIAMEMIMAVVAVVEAFVAIRSVLAVRKTGISCLDGCRQTDRTSCQPNLKFEVSCCSCHCVGSCDLPSYSSSDQAYKITSTDPEKSLVEGLLSLRDEDDEKQPAKMDVKHPLLFYSGTFDQKPQMGYMDQNQIDEDSSDRSKLIEK